MHFPARLFVAHPFKPFNLLPLVEVVSSPRNNSEWLAVLVLLLEKVQMSPLLVEKERPSHITDRFLEALWLIHDEVATTQKIDRAITYGFGLRWAQMGLFETCRIAGETDGMRHFIE